MSIFGILGRSFRRIQYHELEQMFGRLFLSPFGLRGFCNNSGYYKTLGDQTEKEKDGQTFVRVYDIGCDGTFILECRTWTLLSDFELNVEISSINVLKRIKIEFVFYVTVDGVFMRTNIALLEKIPQKYTLKCYPTH